MLKKGIKILLYSIFTVLLSSCGPNRPEKSNTYVKSKFNRYKDIYRILNDSIAIYTDSLLGTFTPEYMYGWIVDSMICINSSNDRLFAITVEIPGSGKSFLSDDAMELLGKKINKKWYFFKGGGALTIPRNMYGFSATNPPSQYFLSQIARKEMMESALVKKDDEYVVSDKWVDAHFYNSGYYTFGKHKNPGIVGIDEQFEMPRDKQKFDSIHWMLIQRKWKEKIDTNEYKPLRKKKGERPAL